MEKGKFIHSSRLLNCYKKGQLDPVLNKFNQIINNQTFLGAGDDVSTFLYNDNQVMKICTKKCRYFLTFTKNNKSLSEGLQFKEHINDLQPYFLPVLDILYEDKNILVYTQDRCKKIKKQQITREEVLSIFKMVKLMFEKNCIVTDIGPHNIGVYNDQPCLFDYHSLQPIFVNGHIANEVNLHRLGRNLTLYMAFINAPHKTKEYKELMKNSKERSIKKIEKEDLLPYCQIQLSKYLMEEQNAKLNKIIALLDRCIYHLSHEK